MPFLKPKTRARYMPKRKRVYKKRRYPLQKFKPVRGMTRAVMPFTREVETYFHLSDLTGNTTAPFKNFQHTTDGGVVGQISLALEDLPSHSDFTNLFRQYKLNYMKTMTYLGLSDRGEYISFILDLSSLFELMFTIAFHLSDNPLCLSV